MNDLAQTASIVLLTGVPGSGKTLMAVQFMREATLKGVQVYASNVSGLKVPEVIDFEDPTRWLDLPAGSLLVVDEAQKFFRATREVHDYIKEMEEIRHRGIRLLLLTQHPSLLHGNIRALVGFHMHMVRQNGKPSATVYTRSRVIDNVRSDKGLAAEDHYVWAYPTDCYELYTSAEVHTVKRTVPKKYLRALALAGLAAAIVAGVIWKLRPATQAPDGSRAPSALATQSGGAQDSKIKTAVDYAREFSPLIPSAPFSAPAFANRGAASHPEIYCMSARGSRNSDPAPGFVECMCMTEQGTRHVIPDLDCRDIARYSGVYNPFRQPMQSTVQKLAEDPAPTPQAERTEGPRSPVTVGVGTSAPEGQQSAYGGFRSL
jgi:zona occludens toxin (predicted ATPase)